MTNNKSEKVPENTKPRFTAAVSPEIKHRWATIIMSLILICCAARFFVGHGGKPDMTSAVISEDTCVYLESGLITPYAELKKDDLVGILYSQNEDICYIRRAVTELPAIEGYISRDKLNFDFDEANQGIITSGTVYSTPSEENINSEIDAKGMYCTIDEWYGDWRRVTLPRGTDGIWVRAEDISYDADFDGTECEDGEFYRQVKNYLQRLYSAAYSPYYDATVVNGLDGYSESIQNGRLEATFIMKAQHRNYYKDPDTVKYISDAKRLADDTNDKYYEELYLTYYNEYNKINEADFVLKLTADVSHGKIKENTVKLYTELPGDEVVWDELKNGFEDFIISE